MSDHSATVMWNREDAPCRGGTYSLHHVWRFDGGDALSLLPSEASVEVLVGGFGKARRHRHILPGCRGEIPPVDQQIVECSGGRLAGLLDNAGLSEGTEHGGAKVSEVGDGSALSSAGGGEAGKDRSSPRARAAPTA